jgi:hypothetical protein
MVNFVTMLFGEGRLAWFEDKSRWRFFLPLPWQDLSSSVSSKMLGPHSVRRKIKGRWEYMNLDQDEASDPLPREIRHTGP